MLQQIDQPPDPPDELTRRRGVFWMTVRPSGPGFTWITTSWLSETQSRRLVAAGFKRHENGYCAIKCPDREVSRWVGVLGTSLWGT